MKRFVCLLSAFICIIACVPEQATQEETDEKTVHVTGISLDKTSVTIKEGESFSLEASVTPNNAENKAVFWSSSNDAVAKVSDGKVTGITAGSATITAKTEDGGKTASCSVTVESNLAPSVTVGADNISAISVILKGKANLSNSASSDLQVGFQYSKSAGILPSNSTTVDAEDADADYNYTTGITGLEPGTTYYFRSFVRQNGQDTYGETKEFKTQDIESIIETRDATGVETTKATLNAKLDLTDVQYRSLAYGFYWGVSEADQNTDFKCTEIKENAISAALTGLTHQTQYWYKVYVKLDSQTFIGEVKFFTTDVVPELVDLGLSVKWRGWNVGASAPEDYGDYYAWGETEPKDNYSWSTYKWCNGDYDKLTKYCPDNMSYFWDGSGSPDNKTVLDPEDDAAHVKLGGKWRMPTDAEWTELRENCTWTWTSNYNGTGVAGMIVTSNVTGYTGKSIFLPAAGSRYKSDLLEEGSRGGCWSSSLYTDSPMGACFVSFVCGNVFRELGGHRCFGNPVRPVLE